MAIGIALLGAGIFAREEHLPAIQSCESLSLKAIYSRSQKSAEVLRDASGIHVDVYYDSPISTAQSIDALLSRADIQAVVIGVPIMVQPELIRKAISAGKHVLSEKPVAADVSIAQGLIEWYQSCPRQCLWAVGENFRFRNSITSGAQLLQGMDAELLTFHTSLYTLVDENGKYHQTEWRNKPDYQGGYLLDGGVHFTATIRFLLAAMKQKITRVAAFSTLLQENLVPVDTLHAILQVTSGRSGTFNISVGTKFKRAFEFEIVTDKCNMVIRPTEVVITTKDAAGENVVSKQEFESSMGLKEEMKAFASSVESGKLDQRLGPEEALNDLKLLEAMLRSGEDGGKLKILS